MPGINSTHQIGAVFAPNWAVYRAAVALDDDPLHPELVLETIDLSRNASGFGGQIWITAERIAGAGTFDLALVAENIGSLAAVTPYPVVGTQLAVDHLDEVRFTGLIAVPHRILLTNIAAGAEWTLHFTYLSIPSI